MMNSQQFVAFLLAACPSAEATWQEHLEWWGEEGRGFYNDVSVLALHIVECSARGETAEFPAAFGVVERCLTDGDEDAQGVATVGFLEDVQNVASHREPGYTVFEQWLGPRTLTAWRAVEAFWDGKNSLADVIRAERQP